MSYLSTKGGSEHLQVMAQAVPSEFLVITSRRVLTSDLYPGPILADVWGLLNVQTRFQTTPVQYASVIWNCTDIGGLRPKKETDMIMRNAFTPVPVLIALS